MPFWGFDQYTKVAIEAREGKRKQDASYMTTSPGAPYSAQRNQRLLQKEDDKHYNQIHDDGDAQFEIGASDMDNSNNSNSLKNSGK